jgi:cytosine/adenosine deaminase-related metal-dependent hydrolase
MILNMQIGIILARVIDGSAEAVRSEDYYDAATLGGAAALLRDDLGRLVPGAKADITVLDLSAPDLGQAIDPIQTMMIAGRGRHFSTVIIDGRFVMEGGVIPDTDPAGDAARAQAQFDRLVAQYPQRTFGHPPVEEIFSSAYPVVRRAP